MDEYDIQNTDDIQEALKDLLGGTIKSMMESEMTEHLGYEKSVQTPIITATEQRKRFFAVNTESLKLMFPKTETAHLNLRLSRIIRRISPE